MIDMTCHDCRAGVAQIAQFDMAIRCDTHGVVRVPIVLKSELDAALATNAKLQEIIVKLRVANEMLRQAVLSKHDYQGLCPDEQQPYSRDPDCAVCMILIELEAAND
jgi:hypothetical protein